ncbi:MAG TPA: MATE family efflux transporter [Gemmatimonadales bacterium]|nr:MATE family efflux transporter [Gemmatimonadales bacterium]
MNPSTDPPVRSPLRAILALSFPIVVVNVGMMFMGTVDTLMVGRVSAEALAAVAIGNVYFYGLVMLGVGILLALDPVISQALGAEDHLGVTLGVQRGMLLAALLSLPVMVLLALGEPILRRLDQPAEVMPLVGTYCVLLVPGVFPFLAFNVGRQTLQAMHRVAPIVWTIVIANLANVGLNRWLIFGGLGVAPMGVAGSAWATTISRVLMAVMVFQLGRGDLAGTLRPWHPESWGRRALYRLFRLGLPIGIQIEIEFAAFSTVALLMGTFGTVAVAGHQIALNLASLTFMVPMGVGMGAAVVVGRAVGRHDPARLRAAARAALGVGAGFMFCTAGVLLLLPRFLASLYSTDPAVVAFAAALLPIAGIFQVFDGLQVVSAGILRGLGDTAAPMLINLVGFAGVGISASILLAFKTSLGPVGLWWGLVLGLSSVALILLLRVRVAIQRPRARVAT